MLPHRELLATTGPKKFSAPAKVKKVIAQVKNTAAKKAAKKAAAQTKKTASAVNAPPPEKATDSTRPGKAKAVGVDALVAGAPRKPGLSLAKTPKRFRMQMCVDGAAAERLPCLYPPAIAVSDLKKSELTIGCDFAGIAGPCIALSMLGVPYRMLWASESDESCRKMLRTHWQERAGGEKMIIFEDATAMPMHTLPSPDIYIATSPCQSFSQGGKQKGTDDERGRLIYHPVSVVTKLKHPPNIIIIENVLALFQRHKHVYNNLVSQLENVGYKLVNKANPIFDTKCHGVPQSRKRVILVGIFSPTDGPVAWTPPAPFSQCPLLNVFVDGRGTEATPKFDQQIEKALHKLGARRAAAPLTEMVCDLAASPRFQTISAHFCPCLTATRAMTKTGFYVHSKKAFLSMNDKVRLMGYPVGCYHPAKAKVSQGRFGHQLGNCVSGNVMMRLWPQILKAGKLLKSRTTVRDMWAELIGFCEDLAITTPIDPVPTGRHGGLSPASSAAEPASASTPIAHEAAAS